MSPTIRRNRVAGRTLPLVDREWTLEKAGLAYAAQGLYVGPLAAKSKNPGSILGSGWQSKTSNDPTVIRKWFRSSKAAGIFIHTGPSKLVVFDLDATEQLQDLPEEIRNELSAAPFQRSRGEGDRGHYIFSSDAPLGNRSGGFAPWGDVRAGNGVIVAAPTPHASEDATYEIIRPGFIPGLPDLLRTLIGGSTSLPASPSLSAHEVETALNKLDGHQDPTALVNGPVATFRRKVEEGSSRHQALVVSMMLGVQDARDGLYSGAALLETMDLDYAASFRTERKGGRRHPHPNEVRSVAAWCLAQPSRSEMARTLWASSGVLRLIDRWAQERSVVNWGLLGVALMWAIATIPPNRLLPGVVGSAAPINMFLALVGESGAGKGITEQVARDMLEVEPLVEEDIYRGKPGSGEGLPKMFGRHRGGRNTAFEAHYTRVYASLPEVDMLGALVARDGATLSSALRECWSGEALGHDYSGDDKRARINGRSYRFVLTVGVQPARSEVLFEGHEGGLTQRFLWAAVQDKDAKLPTLDTSDLRRIRLPDWSDFDSVEWRDEMTSQAHDGVFHELSVPEFVASEIRSARARTIRKRQGGLDGHRLLLMEKVATGFAVLHGVTSGFSEDHWRMAELLMQHSDAVREDAARVVQRSRTATRNARARERGVSSVVESTAAHQARLEQTRTRILDQLGDQSAVAAASLKRGLSKPQREMFEDCLRELQGNQIIEIVSAESGGTTGRKIRLLK